MLQRELPERSHLVQRQQILLFGNARWTAIARTVVIGPYLHISYQDSTSYPYLDNGLAEQSVRSTVLEQSPWGKDRMDQRDCCPGSTRESIKSDQRYTNPTSRATLRRSRMSCRRKRPKRERTMDRTVGIAGCVSVCEEGQTAIL